MCIYVYINEMTMKPISLESLSEHRRTVTHQDIRQHNICACNYFCFFLLPPPLCLSRALASIHTVKKKDKEKQKHFPQSICIKNFSVTLSQFYVFLKATCFTSVKKLTVYQYTCILSGLQTASLFCFPFILK